MRWSDLLVKMFQQRALANQAKEMGYERQCHILRQQLMQKIGQSNIIFHNVSVEHRAKQGRQYYRQNVICPHHNKIVILI